MVEGVPTSKAVGDIMLGDHPVCYGHGVRSTIENNGFDFITEKLGQVLPGADIVFGNLESVLSDVGYDPGSMPTAELRGRPAYAKALADFGFNVLNAANNHALQHGENAFSETVQRRLLRGRGGKLKNVVSLVSG